MDREFYESLFDKRFSWSLAYFTQLVFWGSFIVAVLFSLAVVPRMVSFVNSSIDGIITHFPEELTITINKGVAQSNVKEPYEITVPPAAKADVPYDRYAVISTKKPVTLDEFKKYNSLLLLTADSVYFKDSRKIEIIPLEGIEKMVINNDNLVVWGKKITPWLKLLIPLSMLLMFFFVFTLSFVLLFVYLFFVAFLVWLAMRMQKNHIDYFQAFHLSLHVISFPYFLGIFFFLLGFPLPILMVTFVTIFMVFVLVRHGVYLDPRQRDIL